MNTTKQFEITSPSGLTYLLLAEQNKQAPLLMDIPASIPADVSTSKASVFKRPGDPIESQALKRAR